MASRTWVIEFEKLARQGDAGTDLMRMMLAVNDIVLANIAMRPYMSDHRKNAALLRYFFRLQCGHLSEALPLLDLVRATPRLSSVFATCSSDAHECFNDLLAAYTRQVKPELQGIVKRIRNKVAAHYDAKMFERALQRRAAAGAVGTVTFGEDIGETRYSIADDVEETIVARNIFALSDSLSPAQFETESNDRLEYVTSLCKKYERFCREFAYRCLQDFGAI